MVDDYYKNHWISLAGQLKNKGVVSAKEKQSYKNMIASPDEENLILAEEMIKLRMSDALIEGLNKDQTLAFRELISYLVDPEDYNAVVLKGYAGTGKTFLIQRVIEYIMNSDVKDQIAITAPTNKAVHVLHKNSPYTNDTTVFTDDDYKLNDDQRLVYSTVHKMLGLKEVISDTGVQSFLPSSDGIIGTFKYIIVDETSMLSDDLFKMIMEHKKHDARVIYMGDPAQIPPINKEHSIPFMQNPKDWNFKRLELREIMRQKGSHAVVDASMVIRDNLMKPFPLSINTNVNDDGDGLIKICSKTERTQVRELIRKYICNGNYHENPNSFKMIAWKNATVNQLNNIVQEELYGKDAKKFNVNDIIVANKTLFTRDTSGKYVEYTIKAHTSQEFVIKEMDEITVCFNEKYKSTPFYKLEMKMYSLVCLPIDNKEWGCENFLICHEDSLAQYKTLLNTVKILAKKLKNKEMWVLYYNMLKWSDNVTLGYAITAHKSQGSTYENVLFMEADLENNKKVKERNRIKYTSYTRPKHKLYVFV